MSWPLTFISEADFRNHVIATIEKYGEKLDSYDIRRFNSNIVDPVKLIFDKMVYRSTWEEIVKNEIFRQRDKSNNNDIGYFHQRIFQYMDKCHVPPNGKEGGWDVIFQDPDGILLATGDRVHTIYVEMKNKHNTMNSASTSSTYLKMQAKLLEDDSATCMLVECISKRSQDIAWKASVKTNGFTRTYCHDHIRRVSMDKFYEIVYGDKYAFYKLCKALPDILDDVIEGNESAMLRNSVYDELDKTDFYKSLYLLAFQTYEGFDNF